MKWLARLWVIWTVALLLAIGYQLIPEIPDDGAGSTRGSTPGLFLIHAPMPAHGPSNDPWPDCNNSFSRPENYPPYAILRCPKRI